MRDPRVGEFARIRIVVGLHRNRIGIVEEVRSPNFNPCPGLPDERIDVRLGQDGFGDTIVALDRGEIIVCDGFGNSLE